MKDQILAKLSELATEKQISILYACESGSRAWGFASPDSDFDVRFIYAKPVEAYLSLQFGSDEIRKMYSKELDFAAWELRKLLNLLRKSNASPFEWMQSPILYRQQEPFIEELRTLAPQYFSPKACAFHYFGIAHNSLKSGVVGEQFKLKKYFYVLRPLLCAMWICHYQQIPPLEFTQLFPLLEKYPQQLRLIEELLTRKKVALEGELVDRIPELDTFIAEKMAFVQERANLLTVQKGDIGQLDAFFQKWIGFSTS